MQVQRAFVGLAVLFVSLTLLLGFPVFLRHGLTAGVLLGVLAAVFWMLLLGTARLAWSRAWAFLSWRADGGRAPSRARRIAVVGGRLEGVGPPVASPLTGRTGLAWEVELKGPLPEASGAATWSGAAQAELILETATGPVPIRTGLLVTGHEWQTLRIRDVGERMQRYVDETDFVEIGGWGGAGRMAAELDRAFGEAHGFQWHVRRRLGGAASRRRAAKERVLEGGGEVTCVGPYDPTRGLLPMQELFLGKPGAVIRGFGIEVAVATFATAIFGVTQGLYLWAVFGPVAP